MLSDLSPGDKLSLKGKIFELQKTLQIIDIRNKQKEEFSYKPTLYNYDLPDRDNNVLDSINKAEIIRKVSVAFSVQIVLLRGSKFHRNRFTAKEGDAAGGCVAAK